MINQSGGQFLANCLRSKKKKMEGRVNGRKERKEGGG